MHIVSETPKIQPTGVLQPFDVQVISGPLAVRTALQMVFDRLTPLALEVEETSTVELVLAEALNNIVEHAYPLPDASGPIHLHLRQGPDGLHVRLRDWGREMTDVKTPDGRAECCNVDLMDLPEGGFGWFLIKDLSRDVKYERIDGRNQLELRIAVAFRN
ncbi:MAG: ATP-binding protein [Sulfitobacter sp.]